MYDKLYAGSNGIYKKKKTNKPESTSDIYQNIVIHFVFKTLLWNLSANVEPSEKVFV